MHKASFLISQETEERPSLPLRVSQEGEKGNKELCMHINKAIFWLAEWLEIISNGMFYLSTSPHCNRQKVSNTFCKKSLVGLEVVCSQFSCSQNSSVNTLRLCSPMKIEISFLLYNSVRQCKTSPEPQWLQVPTLTNIKKQNQKSQNLSTWRLPSQAWKYRNGTLWKDQCERWEDKLLSKEQSEQRSVSWPHLLLPLTQALPSLLTLKLLHEGKSVQEISLEVVPSCVFLIYSNPVWVGWQFEVWLHSVELLQLLWKSVGAVLWKYIKLKLSLYPTGHPRNPNKSSLIVRPKVKVIARHKRLLDINITIFTCPSSRQWQEKWQNPSSD